MSLLKVLESDPEVRRLFGKREIVIIKKQLLGVRLTPSERTRLSRDIRKKFEAIEDLARFVSDFKLKKGAEIRKTVEDAREIIVRGRFYPRIKRIVLYGSASENALTLTSDIDIAVDFIDINPEEAMLFRKEISAKVSERIDIQVYNALPSNLKKDIDSKGKVIYERPHKGKN